MKTRFVKRIANAFLFLFLTVLFVACGSSPSTSAATTPTAATPTQPPAATPTQPPTPTSAGGAFTAFTGTGFTLKYPAGWQASQKSKTASGKTIYSFEYSDDITGFHVALHTNYLDTATPIADLTGADMNCDLTTIALPKTVTTNGVTFYQSDFLCMLASTYYEVRLLTTTDTTGPQGQTTIVYGAYQQATASPPFAEADQKYFEPMLQSFKFA